MAIDSKKLKILPQSPGVYIFRDKNRKVLYVGKAASLKDRVNSYFVPSPALRASSPASGRGGRMIEIFISEVTDLEIRKTDTVLEAYILEQELIKKFQPKYNMMSKDDKSFCYVVVTKEDYSRFVVMRKTDLEKVKSQRSKVKNASQKSKVEEKIQDTKYEIQDTIYGPYTSKKQIETVLKILRKIFPYHSKSERSEKECFDYHIGLCPGPYDGAISKTDYKKNIKAIQMILEGKKNNLVRKMKAEMHNYSDKQNYENAAKLRNQMFALKHIQDIALISERGNRGDSVSIMETESPLRVEGYDISNISGKHSVGSMVVFDNAGGEMKANKDQYRKFKIKTIEGANDVGMMEEVLMRRFRNNWKLPNLIILDGGRGHLNMARRVLRIYHLEIPLLSVAKGSTRKKLDFYSFGAMPKIPKNIIEQVRNEAHRFAISYHRKLRREEIRN